ncbi:MAG TPA: DJ-1/PfpI family protein [Bacillaceae bacterium]
MKAAFLAYDECAVWQVSLLQMFLSRHGWSIDTLTIGGKEIVTDGGLTVKATKPVDRQYAKDYGLIMMAGGRMTKELAQESSIRNFLQESTGIIAASCASSVLAGAAGLVTGPFTAMRDTVNRFDEYFTEGKYMDSDICIDGRLITCKGFAHYELTDAVLEETGVSDDDPNVRRAALKLSRNQMLTT